MAVPSFRDLQSVKLKRTPPPKVPLGTTSSPNGDFPSATGGVTVASVRNRFEQKHTPSAKAHRGSLARQDDDKPSEESVVSVASARAKFEPKPAKKTPSPRKQNNSSQSVSQSKDDRHRADHSSNVLKGEPRLKELPPFFRIGAAPYKKHKPADLKFRLQKYRDQIVLSNGANNADRTSNKGRVETKNRSIFYDLIVRQYINFSRDLTLKNFVLTTRQRRYFSREVGFQWVFNGFSLPFYLRTKFL